MHDLDRTRLEAEFDDDEEFGDDAELAELAELEQEDEFEEEDDDLDADELEASGAAPVAGSPFDEAEEMELAAEFLEVTDDAELEQFLGRLVRRAGRRLRKAGRRVRRSLRGRVGRTLRRGLRRVAKRGLRFAGRAVGGAFGGPVGAAVGGAAGRGLGRAFGLELEGLSPEDQEFEGARRFVRLAGEATSMAAAVPTEVDDDEAATRAVRGAIRKNAPGMTRGRPRPGRGNAGRWVRRGNRIVVMGV